MADFAGSGALVQAAVVGVDGSDVEVRNDFIGTGVKVTNLDPVGPKKINLLDSFTQSVINMYTSRKMKVSFRPIPR